MKFLLDETFPFALSRRLRGAGKEVEHVVALGPRGVGDEELRERLNGEALVFLTHDQELDDIPAERLFEILPSGELVAWEILEFGRVLRGPI